MHLIRRLRGAAATILDHIAGPLGWDVYVTATCGLPGVDKIHIFRRPAGVPRPRRLRVKAL